MMENGWLQVRIHSSNRCTEMLQRAKSCFLMRKTLKRSSFCNHWTPIIYPSDTDGSESFDPVFEK